MLEKKPNCLKAQVADYGLTIDAKSHKAQGDGDGNSVVPHDDCKAVVARLTTPRCSPIPRNDGCVVIAEGSGGGAAVSTNGSDFEVVSIIARRRGGGVD